MNKNHPRSASQGFLESLLAWNFVPRLPSQLTRLTPAWLGDPVSDNKTNNMTAVRGTYEHGIYLPDPLDVRDVKRLLRGYVPQELVDIIIEFAEYWPHSTSSVYFGDDNPFVLYGHPRETDRLEDMFLLRTPPVGLPRWGDGDQALFRAPIKPRPSGEAYLPEDFTNDKILGHPCRRIVFTIRSHDQGWGGNLEDQGSFRGSWTWFEAGLERWCKRNESELLSQQVLEAKEPSGQSGQPSMKLQDLSTVYPEVEYIERNQAYEFVFPIHPADNLQIQCNTTAERQWQDHRVEWRHDDSIDDPARLEEAGRGTGTGNGQFVRELRVGDVVTVWAKVRFPGWVNNIASVKVDVFWAE